MRISQRQLRCFVFVFFVLVPIVLEPHKDASRAVRSQPVMAAQSERRAANRTLPARPSATPLKPSATAAYGNLPLQFEENRGQTDERVKYLARGRGYLFFLTSRETVLALRRGAPALNRGALRRGSSPDTEASAAVTGERSETVLRFELEGANAKPRIEAVDRLPGISNYFIGNDPARWRTKIPNYAKVIVRGVYPGIDAAYYGKEGRLESDFIVAPGRGPGAIRMKITGAQQIEVNSAGDLVLATEAGDVKLAKPVLYQEVRGARREVAGSYQLLSPDEVGFTAGPYDQRWPLVIDPTLVYSTYLGGSGMNGDAANAIAVDSAGAAYVTGFTTSTDFPVASPHQGALGGPFAQNAFVTKLSPSGAAQVFSTYLGGSGTDTAFGIALDPAGEPYITGSTTSTDFPKTVPTSALNGSQDAFVTKLSANGSALLFSFYFGGSSSDQGLAIAVDASGNAYVTGDTSSPTMFPVTPGVIQGALAGGQNAFVAKIGSTGIVTWATYLGGNASDSGTGIAVDKANPANVYVTGSTTSTTFPMQTPIQANLGGPFANNAFVTELNPSGTALVYSTYLGGDSFDPATGIAVDSGGNTIVTGTSSSQNFPLFAPLQAHDSSEDAFVAKITPGGGSFVFSTVFGDRNGQTHARAVAIDPSGNIYIAGDTSAYLLPTLNPLQGPSMLGNACECGSGQSQRAGMVIEIKPDGSDYLFSTFFGGSSLPMGSFGSVTESASGIAADSSGNVYIAGLAGSTDFPTFSPFQATLNSVSTNAFVAKISPGTPPGPQVFPSTLSLQTSAVGSSSSVAQITVLNGTNTLNISSITFTGPNAADFTETDSCLPELLPHAVCTIIVQGTPLVGTPETATLNIADSDTSSPQLVALTVTVVTTTTPPTGTLTVTPSPSVPDFGLQEVLTTSSAQFVTLSNTGAVPVSVSIFPGGEFSLAAGGSCPGTSTVTLPVGTSCTVGVVFTPFSSGPISGTLQVFGNFTTSPALVGLSGTGFVIATLSPTFTTFSSFGAAQVVGSPSSTMFLTLTNTSGSTPLTSISVSVLPPTLGYAVVSNTCGSTLGPGSSCFIGIVYTPNTAGQTSATLQVTSSDPVVQNGFLFGYALNAQATLAPIFPTSLNFGPRPIGSQGSNSTFLQNIGNAPLAISESLVASGTNPAPGDYSVMDTCSGIIPAGGSCGLSVTFTPSAAGLRTAAVMISSSTAGAIGVPQTVTLTGSGSKLTTATAAPATVTFPNTALNVTSAPLLVTFTNTGTRPLLFTTSPALGGANPGDFSFSFPFSFVGCSQSFIGAQFNPQIACPITFFFTPTATGMRTATFTITDTSSNSPHVVTLQGNGPSGAVIFVSPNPLNFGNQQISTTSAPQMLTLMNSGTGTLSITGFSITGTNSGDFMQAAGGTCSALPISLNAGISCTVLFTFTPSTTTTETPTLTITNNGTTPMQMVGLSGTGTPGPAPVFGAAPNPLAFGNQVQSTTSAPATLTFSNTTGTATLTITALVLGGANPGDFLQVAGAGTCGPLPISVSTGGSCTVLFTFTPGATGARSATLQATDNAAGSPHMVSLTGTGTAPPAPAVSLSTPVLAFGAIAVGSSSSPMTLTVTNSGNATLNITTVTITGANAGDFSPPAAGTTCTNGVMVGFTAGANTCVINIIFTPTATGTRTATITITDNAATSPQTVTLTGGGPGFTFTAPPTPGGGPGNQVTLLPGDTGQFTLVLTLNPGFGPITLTCGTPLPPHTICTVSPSTIPMNTSAAPLMYTITVTLQTNCVTGLIAPRGPGGGPVPPRGMPAPLAALWLGTLMLLAVMRRYLPQRWALRLAPALVLLLLVVTWTGCVSNPPAILPGQPQTPPGNYTLPITATSSSGTQTLLLMVRVI
jgi:hypothetical protein